MSQGKTVLPCFAACVIGEDQPGTAWPACYRPTLPRITEWFGAAGVHLRLTTLFGNDQKAGSFMRSLLHINANDLGQSSII